MTRPGWLGVALLAALAAGAAWAQEAAAYRIGAKDELEIRVFEVPELNVKRRVSAEGAISLPLIGDVRAAGLTEAELAQRLKSLLESRYVQRASVAVEVSEFRSKPISVIGAVKQPGALNFSGRWTLLEAITAAGGLGDGHGEYVYVMRHASNGLTDQVAIRLADLLVRADAKVNIPIFASDLINIPARVKVTIYCLGEVNSPGALVFESGERVTLLSVIARAGGLSERASNRILIKRQAPAAGERQLEAHYKRILSGKDSDLELKEGDVVVVKEAFL